METIRKYLGKWYTYPIVLFLVGAASYLYQLTQMGFYWDDWQAVLLYQINDPKVISAYFSFDRPFSAWTYQLLFPLLPMRAWIWQLVTMLFRWLAILALIEAFLLVWPKRRWLFNWVGLLLYVAPAFYSEPIAVAFNQHFLTMLIFALSLLFTGLAIKKKRLFWVFLPLALITTAAHLFTMEYFVGLEVMRIVYIYFLISQRETRWQVASRKTVLTWAPYGAIAAFFIYWRLVIYPNQAVGFLPNDPVIFKQILSNPGQAAFNLITRSAKDVMYLFVNSWVNSISPDVLNFTLKANLFSWAVGLIVALIAAVSLFTINRAGPTVENVDKFHYQGLFAGIVAVAFGGLPVWLIARQITEGKWSDRFSLAPIIGVTIILVIMFDWIIRTKLQKHVLLAILLGISIAFQMRNVNKFRLDWQVQQEFYWQLAWRVPDLRSGTVVYSPTIPNEKLSDYTTAFAINVLYAKESMNLNLPYWFFTPRYLDPSYVVTNQNQIIQQNIRNLQFMGSTANMISVYYRSSDRCLKVLDSLYQQDPFLKTIDPIFFKVNNNSRILSPGYSVKPSETIFGMEPAHSWCYYFEKADLARQNQQWKEVINLMDEAFTKNLNPVTGSELLPLLDAYIQTGDWGRVIKTASQMVTITQEIKPAICFQLSNIHSSNEINIPQEVMAQLQSSMQCE